MAKTATPFDVDFSKIWSEFKLPVVDVEQIAAMQRKNFEAMTAANQLAVEGVQTLIKRQAEIAKSAWEGASSMVSELSAAGTPEDKIARQVELVKQAYENCLSSTKELAEICAKSNEEAAEIISDRFVSCCDEIKSVAKKGKKAA